MELRSYFSLLVTLEPVTNGGYSLTLSTLLRGLVSKNLKELDLMLPDVEFAYNRGPTYVTSHYPFKAYYRVSPLTLIDILLFPIELKVNFEA